MNPNIIKKANDLVNSCTEGYVAQIDAGGYPRVATRSVRCADGIYSFYFTTNKGGNMANAIERSGKASVCFNKENSNVTLVGDFEIVTDKSIKESVWVDWFIKHYPEGTADPSYFVVKFTSRSASLWIDGEGASFVISDVSRIQSRCGLMCDTCAFREPYNCGGCIETLGHPFHGECPIAICAQKKGFEHCGQCLDMPCDKLYEYSCGDDENCDNPKGARLEILKYWSANG